MTIKQRYIATATLVIVSLVGSVCSFFTINAGKKEVYPFYYWKLYSQPAGWELTHSGYRIYATNDVTAWNRIPNYGRATFDRDETLYFLNPIANAIEEGNVTDEDLTKLKIWCGYLVPEFEHHKIVKETFNPREIIDQPEKFLTEDVYVVD